MFRQSVVCLIVLWSGSVLAESVLSKSICIQTLNGCSPLIGKGATLPASHTETFSNGQDNQDKVRIGLYQGEGSNQENNKLIGNFDLAISKMPAGKASLQVTLVVDREKRLTIKTYDLSTKERHEVEAGIVE